MEYHEFLSHYMAKLGESIKDEYFNTKKLTKTAIFNRVIEIFFNEPLKGAYEKGIYANIVYYLGKIVDIAKAMGIPSRYYERTLNPMSNDYYLPYSIGNDKIGDDTICISINTGLLCYMGLTGNCDNCSICYARKSNIRYASETIKNTISQLNFIQCDALSLALNTLKAIKKELSANKVNNLKFLRINVNGDILDNWQLEKIDYIAGIIKKELNLISCYSYTHNQGLNLDMSQNIVFNTSFKSNHPKNCLTALQMEEKFKDDNKYIVCNGDCNGCSYCKNPYETRTIIFLAHGGGLKGVKQLSEEYLKELEFNKWFDYEIFLNQMEDLECY